MDGSLPRSSALSLRSPPPEQVGRAETLRVHGEVFPAGRPHGLSSLADDATRPTTTTVRVGGVRLVLDRGETVTFAPLSDQFLACRLVAPLAPGGRANVLHVVAVSEAWAIDLLAQGHAGR